MENSKVAIYCRLSVEDIDKMERGDDSESIQNQKLLLLDYAMEQGWTIHKVYSDDDYSGLDRNRPEFRKMITDAEEGHFNIILCKTQSRFTRDMEMVEKYLHGKFLLWGIRFVSIVDNVDTAVKGNKKARQIYGLINEWYSEDLSENIRAVFRKKMQDGQYLGAFAAYGYAKDPTNKHKLIIDEEAANVVRHIFDLYIQGYGCQQISKTLIQNGVPTPTVYKKNKGMNFENPNAGQYSISHGVWALNTIGKILRNKIYIGTLIQGRERKVSYKSNKIIIAPQEEWVVIEDNHAPIVDKNVFYTVQSLMDAKRRHHLPKSGEYSGTAQAHVLAGKVRCSDCNTIMTRSAPARNGDHYLRCALAYRTKDYDRRCTPHTIKLEELIKIVEERVRKLINDYLTDENERKMLKTYCFKGDELRSQITTKENELRSTKSKYAELSRVVTDAYIDKTKGVLTEMDFMGIKERLSDDMNRLSKQQIVLENAIEELRAKVSNLRSVDDVLSKYITFESLTHTMVNDFIDYIEVHEKAASGERKVVIHWLF